jgi:uncharacterized membrane protein
MIARAATALRAWPRASIGPALVFAIATFFLAGAIHIAAILLVPIVARVDGWTRLAALAGENRFVELPLFGPGAADAVGLDPLFLNGACRLHVGESAAAITLEARDRFWSLALYDPQGTIIFSLNDRTALDGRLDMLVINPSTGAEPDAASSAETDQTVVVETRSKDLVALFRLYAPTAAARGAARRILGGARCLPVSSGESR